MVESLAASVAACDAWLREWLIAAGSGAHFVSVASVPSRRLRPSASEGVAECLRSRWVCRRFAAYLRLMAL